ncbi:MAG: preprotein translocase subunit SecG [Firmicutes bacterium]|nr:preprotein translocase subunit SecG [Bacillota bacterium]
MKWAIAFAVGLLLVLLGWQVRFVLVTLHVLISLTLILVVLLQSGKAADLAGAFGGAGSQTAFGPRGAATFLSKATTWCAVMFMLTSISLVLQETAGPRRPAGGESSLFEETPAAEQAAPAEPPASPPQTQPQSTPQPQPQSPPAQNPTPPQP